jgi:hypothetical protein
MPAEVRRGLAVTLRGSISPPREAGGRNGNDSEACQRTKTKTFFDGLKDFGRGTMAQVMPSSVALTS